MINSFVSTAFRAALVGGAVCIGALSAYAKDIRTLVVTTSPRMHCANCENKIKGNLRFEKGVKKIATDIEHQQVTIEYDAEKNNEENLIDAFGKIGYEVSPVTSAEEATSEETEGINR